MNRRALAFVLLAIAMVGVACKLGPSPRRLVGSGDIQGPQAMAGDVTGTTAANVIAKMQGQTIPSLASGYLHNTGAAFVWDTPGGGTPSGTGLAHITGGTFDGTAVHGTADQLLGANHAGTDTAFFTLAGDAALASGTITVNSAHNGDWVFQTLVGGTLPAIYANGVTPNSTNYTFAYTNAGATFTLNASAFVIDTNGTQRWQVSASNSNSFQPAADNTYSLGTASLRASDVESVKINGSIFPVGGSLTTGNTLGVTGAAALGFSALNLGGGAGYVSGQLPVASGGTGAATLTAHGIVLGEGTSAVALAGPGTSAQILEAQGASADPAFETVSGDGTLSSSGVLNVTSVTHVTSGTLGAGNGGTGVASPTAHALVCGEGSSAMASIGPGTSAQILESQGASADPAFETMSQDATITSSGVVTVGGLKGQALPSLPGSSQCLANNGSAWSFTACSGGGSSVTGTGLWYSSSGTLNAAAVTLTGDVSQQALSGNNVPLNVTSVTHVTSGTLASGNGGTGVASPAAHGLLCGEGSSAAASIGPGTSAQILEAQGASADPAFETVSQDLSLGSTGVATVTGIQTTPVSATTPQDEQILVYHGATSNIVWTASQSGVYGAGSDGTRTADGTSTITCLGAPSSSTYTMTKDCYFINLTVNTGVTIITNGWKLAANGILTLTGTALIQNNGGNGQAGSAGGAAGTGGDTVNGSVGGAVATPGAGGSSGAAGSNGSWISTLCWGGAGGAGGAANGGGGAGGTGAGCTLGSSTNSRIPQTSAELWGAYSVFANGSNVNIKSIQGGSPGGGGGGVGGNVGGGAGASGGVVIIAAHKLTGSGNIQSTGGNGGAGQSGSGTTAGGGGGGAGGFIGVIYWDQGGWTGTNSTAGGTGGTGGTAGTNGGAGNSVFLQSI